MVSGLAAAVVISFTVNNNYHDDSNLTTEVSNTIGVILLIAGAFGGLLF